MTATYVISTDRGKVRFAVGDTNVDAAFLQDDEVDHCLDEASEDIAGASVLACRAIVAKLAREVNTSAAGINSSRTSMFQQYKDLLAELEDAARAGGAAQPFVGGISKERQDTADEDTDLRPNAFSVGMHDTGGSDDPQPGGL